MSRIFDAISVALVIIVFVALSVRLYIAFYRRGGEVVFNDVKPIDNGEVRLTSSYENLNFNTEILNEIVGRQSMSIISLVIESTKTRPALMSTPGYEIDLPVASSISLEVK